MTEIPLVDSANHRQHAQKAIEYRSVLIGHLARAVGQISDIQPNGLTSAQALFCGQLTTRPQVKSRLWLKAMVGLVRISDLVIWRNDLRDYAHAQAEEFADLIVTDSDLPLNSELWLSYGQLEETSTTGDDEHGTHTLLFELVFPIPIDGSPSSKAKRLIRASFLLPLYDGVVNINVMPKLALEVLLTVGQPPKNNAAKKFLSCLSFRASTFVSDEKVSNALSRSERRRIERSGIPTPDVWIVNLRRKEPTSKDRADDLHTTEYQYQWYVRPHVRRPSPRMKEQRPTWVSGYLKGPEGKPLKPRTMNVKLVNR